MLTDVYSDVELAWTSCRRLPQCSVHAAAAAPWRWRATAAALAARLTHSLRGQSQSQQTHHYPHPTVLITLQYYVRGERYSDSVGHFTYFLSLYKSNIVQQGHPCILRVPTPSRFAVSLELIRYVYDAISPVKLNKNMSFWWKNPGRLVRLFVKTHDVLKILKGGGGGWAQGRGGLATRLFFVFSLISRNM